VAMKTETPAATMSSSLTATAANESESLYQALQTGYVSEESELGFESSRYGVENDSATHLDSEEGLALQPNRTQQHLSIFDDAELPPGVDSYTTREVRMNAEATVPIRSELRSTAVFALVLGALAGVVYTAVGIQQAYGHPRQSNSHRTVGLLARPGDGACMLYGGHVHPSGRKCCSPQCLVGNINYCGSRQCWQQGPSGVLNCCRNSTKVPTCGVRSAMAPCMLPITTTTKSTTTTTTITTTSTTTTTTTITTTTTTTTITTTSTSTTASSAVCGSPLQPQVAYMNHVIQNLFDVASVSVCQTKCLLVHGCAKVSFCESGFCSGNCILANYTSQATASPDWISGPSACPFDCSFEATDRARAKILLTWSDTKMTWCCERGMCPLTS